MAEEQEACNNKAKITLRYLFIVILCLLSFGMQAQVSICSWNLANFGNSKSEEEIVFIAAQLRQFDIVAIEEVMAGNGGPDAVIRLCEALNQAGHKWRYSISEPTSSYENRQQRERYAFIWKEERVILEDTAVLSAQFEKEIEREPFIATFSYEKKKFAVAAFHALPKKKQPEREIKYLQYLFHPENGIPLLFVGDFNCPASHTVFLPLKEKGYRQALQQQKTTLKQECKAGECLASEYDNIFYPSAKVKLKNAGVLPFHQSFANDMKKARQLSDHLPVFAIFSLN